MRLSVVMPVYNAAPYVRAAASSALMQMQGDAELICVDDGSTDTSWDEIARISDPRLKRLRQENQGAAAARNAALDLAQGDAIAFLDADDLALPGRFEIPLQALTADSSLSIVGASLRVIDPQGLVLRDDGKSAQDTYLRWITLFNSPFTFSAVTVRRSDLRFDSSVIPAEDYAYCADMLDRGKGVILADVLCAYRVHPGQVTQRRNDALRDSGNRISQRKIRERLGVDVPLELVFLMRHLLAFGWERLSPEHHAMAFEAQRTLQHLFSLFKRGDGLDAGDVAKIEEGFCHFGLKKSASS
ncbi:MAG: glycosyltransferase family 2 protein [Alphaproteobacteria bacterium]|nr:glycosyltransferase family 2 protein [Alphaproteobacteria bacterium]